MKTYENLRYDEERALYGSHNVHLRSCSFDGPADGESALKESQDILVENCFCNLRYPFWHDTGLVIHATELTELCRAAIWYSKEIKISDSKLHGIKALRECADVVIHNCEICSSEFGWSVNGMEMQHSSVEGEYAFLRSAGLHFSDVTLKGKYSFQYLENGDFSNCNFDTKDAFWHAKNVTVSDSVVKGEYLAWYSDGLTLERCKIIGTQPLCYCKNLRLIDCEMIDTDLSFEKSQVNATLTAPILSIKNPQSGQIQVPSVGELIFDDPQAKGEVLLTK